MPAHSLSTWHRCHLRHFSGPPGPLCLPHAHPAAPPVFFPPAKPLQTQTPVTCSAAVALYGHRPMPTVSPSSENPNHTVVCRALSSLVPVGSLAVSPMAPLPAQLQSHRPPCCPETCQGCSRLAAFMLHPLPEKLFLIHFCAKGALSRGLSCSSPAHSVTRPCPTSSEHLSHLTVCI